MQVSNARHRPTMSEMAERPLVASKRDGQSFAGLIDGAPQPPVSDRPAGTAVTSQGEKLTQFLLTQSVQSMLPKDETQSGSGFAGDVWRGMLAETLSETLAHAIGSLVPEPGGAEVPDTGSLREVAQ